MFRMIVIALVLAPAGLSLGQDGPKPDQLKRMYDDALVQLRSAQDRKNELANENENLKAKVAELNKELETMSVETARLRGQTQTFAAQTYAMRARVAACDAFMSRDERIAAKWSVFMERAFPGIENGGVIDWDWPFLAINTRTRPASGTAKRGKMQSGQEIALSWARR